MDNLNNSITPSTPRRPALSNLSPIKHADNSFNPIITQKRRRRGPNIKPRSTFRRIIHEDHENEEVSVAIPVYNSPSTSSSIHQPHNALLDSSTPSITSSINGGVPSSFMNHTAEQGPPSKRRRALRRASRAHNA